MMHRFGHHWIYGHPWGDGFGWWPGMLLTALSTLFWIALLIGLAWVLLRWIMPYIKPMIADIFGVPPADPSALEILRQRYAAGEIDAFTFEEMRVRLEASYQQGRYGIPPDGNGYPSGNWTGYRNTYYSPISRGQGKERMAELADPER